MTETRSETDSLGQIDVPAEMYWGAQTERSRRMQQQKQLCRKRI